MNTDLSNSNFELSVKGLTIIYSNGHKALFNVNCQLKSGTICALLGANGSGKSTLFKSIMGVIKYQQGEISLNQKPIKESLKKSLIAYVPQSEDIDWNFPVSVNDVVMMGRYGYMNFLRLPSVGDKIAVHEALERLAINHLGNRQIGELSGGQRKRVFLARALAQGAKILLLDEPFTGIDSQTELAIIDLLKQLRDVGCLILISTHNLSAVPQFADEVILVNRTIVAAGPTKKIFTLENLKNAFGNKNIGLSGLFS